MKARLSVLALALAASSVASSAFAVRRVSPGFWVTFGTAPGMGTNQPAYDALNAAIGTAFGEGNLREYKIVRSPQTSDFKVCFVFAKPVSAFDVIVSMNDAGLMDSRMSVMGAADCRD
jgi:hypothetical protein